MYFLALGPLKERLAAGPLPERETPPYVVLVAVAAAVAAFPSAGLLDDGLPNAWDRIQSFLELVMAVAGTLILYRANGGAEGREFIHRWVVVGWVVAVRFCLMVVPVAAGLRLLSEHWGWSGDRTGIYDVVSGFVIDLLFYAYFGLHLDDLRRATDRVRGPVSGNGAVPPPVG